MEQFWTEQAAWSQATFGSDAERGPQGSLKHLCREALTELLGIPRDTVTDVLALASEPPRDVEEYADLLFLVFDATRRAGFGYRELLDAANAKLVKNKARKWPAPVAGSTEPTEHVRDDEEEPESDPTDVWVDEGGEG